MSHFSYSIDNQYFIFLHTHTVHGNWGDWYELEECTQPCGRGGTKRQRRYCDSPAPLYNGNQCTGSNEKLFSCNEDKLCEG